MDAVNKKSGDKSVSANNLYTHVYQGDITLFGNDIFKFKRGWKSFAPPTYTDRYNGIFGRNATYTILGVFEYKTNNFMNWNNNPLR